MHSLRDVVVDLALDPRERVVAEAIVCSEVVVRN